MDASGDGQVTSMDALLVINWLNTHPSGATPSHLDLNHDGAVTPLDALVTINQRTRSVIQARAAINAQAIDQHWAFDDEDDSEGWLDEELLELMVP
ncbi:dockerin type I domain-containing protein [Novipirellula artificiosorum]|nr:dockerin type I domain-containing protein [Novipirellula artificiosorum]